jgi:deazaflavin-dependent oxidoreductase (nitroreductase family)
MFRAPVILYRWRLGWLLDHRFLLLVHRGRRTGARRRTVLEVLRFVHERDEAIVISGLGERADWYRNVEHDPHVDVEIGRRHFRAVGRRLSEDEAVAVLAGYEHRNRHIAPVVRALIGRLVGWRYDGSDAQRLRVVRQLPLVSLRRDIGAGPFVLEDPAANWTTRTA